ncbi:hypothetical protein Pla123a_11990 [Posidoniimonas polymericola]|uniref:Glycosyl transferases group 1 n=1 Tax=Posidoniimonas polymericola TaxID=2528002 RepID=A0A5C5YTX1_9BACT|nr:glycosyltransferase family 1 protein [Posidoniimonas polymericola]TWT78408.1 hypothetical protein Pla123a_11990 [Posidoniimonas polymericola]
MTSPQEWGHIKVSKHHYAEELVQAGHSVHFLNPPCDEKLAGGVRCRVLADYGPGRLTVIDWNRRTPIALRYKAMPIYRRLIQHEARRIRQEIDSSLDLLWAFDPNTFPDLSVFKAAHTLFMPVDPLSSDQQVRCGLSADLVVSVTPSILEQFDSPAFEGRKLLVGHGLCREFEAEARRPPSAATAGSPVRAGFFGNLDRPKVFDYGMFSSIVESHPQVEFHFWGPSSLNGEFQKTLADRPNVFPHGCVDKAALASQIRPIDVFLLIYGRNEHLFDRSNAHKILEYLCTGKVIVSSTIEAYEGRLDLLRAPRSGDDTELPLLFAQTVEELDSANSLKLARRRKAYALDHTYRAQLTKIEAALEKIASDAPLSEGATR